jgi:adenylosuccinate lyase
MLHKFIAVVEGLQVYPENMMANLIKTKGLIFSQAVLLALMEKGLSRPRAYDLVQRCAMDTWLKGSAFRDNLLNDKEVAKYIKKEALDKIFDLNYYLRNVDKIYKNVGL